MNNTTESLARLWCADLRCFTTSMRNSILDLSTYTTGWEHEWQKIWGRFWRTDLCYFKKSLDDSIWNLNLSTCTAVWKAWNTSKYWRASGEHTCATPQPQCITLNLIWVHAQQLRKHERHKKLSTLWRANLCLFTASMNDSILDLSTCTRGWEAWTTLTFWHASGAHTCAALQSQWITLTLIWVHVQQV